MSAFFPLAKKARHSETLASPGIPIRAPETSEADITDSSARTRIYRPDPTKQKATLYIVQPTQDANRFLALKRIDITVMRTVFKSNEKA